MDRQVHWDDRYETIGSHAVSWYEDRPTVSLDLLARVGVTPAESVIDVGGGASTLVDHLHAAGHRDLAVLDVSAVALGEARDRLDDPDGVTWLVADVTTWQPDRTWDAWHDRAVLHFLTDELGRQRYRAALRRALAPGGAFVIGTFAEDGPTECSGLPVRRHGADDLASFLEDAEVIEQRRHVHRTPAGIDQPFNWIAGRLRPPP
jgi:SAM-dependent methyltransferase